jgi:hypothetical protein
MAYPLSKLPMAASWMASSGSLDAKEMAMAISWYSERCDDLGGSQNIMAARM